MSLRTCLRAAAATLALALAIPLAACAGAAGADSPASRRPLVLTSFTVLADLGQRIAGERLDVRSITKAGAEIHHYEPTPGDLKTVHDAELVIENGLGLEAWFEQFLQGTTAARVVASEGIAPMAIAGGEAAGQLNPHAWMSPANAEIYVDNLVRAFTSLDPAGADAYAANGADYKEELRGVARTLEDGLARIPAEHRLLATCEGAFSYLARDAGLEEAYLWPVNADGEGTPQQVASLTETVRARQAPAVFCESTVSDRPMREVAEATGARFAGVLYVDSLSEADGPVPSYLDLLRVDAETIVAGLGGAQATS